MGLDTLTNVKARLGITIPDYDAYLQSQIDLISDTIEAYCRRKLAQANYVQTFYREHHKVMHKLTLFQFPVTQITSIIEDGIEYDQVTPAIAPDGFRLHSPTGIVTRDHKLVSAYWFVCGETVVHYQAGYATIPSLILNVLDNLVNENYQKKLMGIDPAFGNNLQKISIPGAISIDFDYSISTDKRDSAFGMILGNWANVLDSFRSERAIIGSDRLEYVETE